MLTKANHTHVKKDGFTFLRGELRATYDDFIECGAYFIGYRKKKPTKTVVRNCLRWFRNEGMITTRKTTRGMVIKIEKYDHYQNPSNYEDPNENHKTTTTEPCPTRTINKNVKNDKNEQEINTEKFVKNLTNSPEYLRAKKTAESLRNHEYDKSHLP